MASIPNSPRRHATVHESAAQKLAAIYDTLHPRSGTLTQVPGGKGHAARQLLAHRHGCRSILGQALLRNLNTMSNILCSSLGMMRLTIDPLHCWRSPRLMLYTQPAPIPEIAVAKLRGCFQPDGYCSLLEYYE
jgi:hypothetical protein